MRSAAAITGSPRAGVPLRLPVLARSLLPGAILMLALFLGLMANAGSLLNDPDTQWHIEVGRRIWAGGSVPSRDLFSHTFKGAPWIAKEWLSQLILFAAHQTAGWDGIVVATSLSIAMSFAILFAWLRRRLQPTMALVATLIAITLALPHFLARPHMLVLPIIVIWMTTIVSALDRERAPPLAFALVMGLWANMHGSFPLGLVMAGTLAGEGVIDAPAGSRVARLRQWSLFLAVALAATALSPYGWRAILVPLQMSGNAATLRYVNEWQPLGLDAIGCLALALLAATMAVMLRRARANLFRIVAVALLAYLMIRHARFISLFGIIVPILGARPLALCRGMAADAEPASKALPGRTLPASAAGLLAAALAMVVISRPQPALEMTPDAAFQAAMAKGVSGPIYNDYDFGGYLIAHGVETFVDGRTDQLFLGDFLPDLEKAVAARDDGAFAALLARYHVTWALVRTHSGDAAHLARMKGWTNIHTDAVAAVYTATR